MRSWTTAAARGMALFLGGFALVNVIGGLWIARFDANVWWLDLRGLPAPVAGVAFAVLGTLLVAWAVRPAAGPRRRAATRVALVAAAAVAIWNAAGVWTLQGVDAFPVPFSLFVAAALIAMDRAIRRPAVGGAAWPVPASAAACAVAFALLQMMCFGRTDYARPADAIVVFGARAYADGRPSWSLADRVRTGSALWREGRAPLLVLSGGPGDGAFHETEVMAALAREAGVPNSAIVLDRRGTNTRATVANVAALLGPRTRVLAVSHGYHLPRVQLAFDRAGVAAFTVPARQARSHRGLPFLVAREVAAVWTYWLVPGRPARPG